MEITTTHKKYVKIDMSKLLDLNVNFIILVFPPNYIEENIRHRWFLNSKQETPS